MKAIEVLNMLVEINYDFFKSLNEYLEQEDATALLVINKEDYKLKSNVIILFKTFISFILLEIE